MKKIDSATRIQLEVAAACGVSERKIAEALGISRGAVRYLRKSERAMKASAHAKWKQGNRKYLLEYGREWRDTPERRAAARERSREWYQSNREHANAKRSRRSKLERRWPLTSIERLMVNNYYEDARRLTKETGIRHEVDHIIPVSKGGPHLPWNLQVLTETENRKKSNR